MDVCKLSDRFKGKEKKVSQFSKTQKLNNEHNSQILTEKSKLNFKKQLEIETDTNINDTFAGHRGYG